MEIHSTDSDTIYEKWLTTASSVLSSISTSLDTSTSSLSLMFCATVTDRFTQDNSKTWTRQQQTRGDDGNGNNGIPLSFPINESIPLVCPSDNPQRARTLPRFCSVSKEQKTNRVDRVASRWIGIISFHHQWDQLEMVQNLLSHVCFARHMQVMVSYSFLTINKEEVQMNSLV